MFYNKHKDSLFSYLLRSTGDSYLSEDIVQESFTRCLEYYGSTVKSPALLYTIARNVLQDNRRSAVRYAPFEENMHHTITPENQLMAREECRLILSALQNLEISERHLIELVVSSRLSYREIAAVTGSSEGNVKVKVNRTRTKLKRMAAEAVREEVSETPTSIMNRI